jgi:hypothetical protein
VQQDSVPDGHLPDDPARIPGGLLAADPLGALTLLYAATGRITATVAMAEAGTVRPQGIAVCRDGSLLLLADTGGLHPAGQGSVYDGEGPAAAPGRIAAHHGQAALRDPGVLPTALGRSPDGGVVVVGDEQGVVHVWRLDGNPGDGDCGPVSRVLHPAPITAVTCLPLPEDKLTLVMSAGTDGTVRLWEPSAEPMPTPVEQRPALVTAMSAAHTPHGPVLAVAWNDSVVTLWHIPTGRVHRLPLLTPCAALSLSSDPHLTVGGPGGTWTFTLDSVRLWA